MPSQNLFRIAVLALLPLVAAACAPGGRTAPAANDPYEAQNRRVHAFNRGVDRALYRPASLAYGTAVPDPLRQTVSNFAGNLSLPSYILNDALQGEAEDAGHNLFRFLVNTTLGVGGIFDPATSMGLAARESDFGQTLSVWGAPQGAYLELPLLGPSTERAAVGTVVDFAMNPARHLASDDVRTALTVSYVGNALNERYLYRGALDQVLYDSADSYALTRESYLQNRRFELGGDDVPDYFNPYDDLFAD